MTPLATSTCQVLDATTTQCVYYVQTGTSTPPLYMPLVFGGNILDSFLLAVVVVLLSVGILFKK